MRKLLLRWKTSPADAASGTEYYAISTVAAAIISAPAAAMRVVGI
jgi:hypothetical protein